MVRKCVSAAAVSIGGAVDADAGSIKAAAAANRAAVLLQ